MSSNYDVSKNFWESQRNYPKYGFTKQRRFYEIAYIYNKIINKNIDSFTDLGCGDGALVSCLYHLLDINSIRCLDLSKNLMSNINLDNKILKKIIIDLCNKPDWPMIPKESTVYNMGGVISFIFDDNFLFELFKYIKGFKFEYFFLRSPCSESNEDIIINTYSEKLKCNYSSVYRTKKNILNILLDLNYNIVDCTRLYPDNIESEFDTRQYMFFINK